MRIGVLGLGYVGTVTAACLARMGHQVWGVDVSPLKVEIVNRGQSPVLEKDLDRLVADAVHRGKFRASVETGDAIAHTDLSLVSVGTPSRRDGSANLAYLLRAMREIGRALQKKSRFHTVVIRSTVPPGTTEERVIPELERWSHRKAGRDFDVCFHPEFLREGSSIYDFFHPSKIVIGSNWTLGARRLRGLWRTLKAPLFVTSFRVAEMVKYVDNAFHALKITFTNEVGALSKSSGINSYEVMEIFAQDKKLNISSAYLRPGFAFGGPCLPKDLRALCRMAKRGRLETPLLQGILESNARHLERAKELVLTTGKKRIGVLGLAFKSGTDDLRESPACNLVRHLLRAGKEVKVYDPRVDLDRLLGANRTFVEKHLPELPSLLVGSLEELVRASQTIVVAGKHPDFQERLKGLGPGRVVIDLVGLNLATPSSRTVGLCW